MREEGHHYLIDGVRLGIEQFSELAAPGPPVWRTPKANDALDDLAGGCAGEPHHTQTAASRGGGDGDDGVSQNGVGQVQLPAGAAALRTATPGSGGRLAPERRLRWIG